jgi:hypothetical protein
MDTMKDQRAVTMGRAGGRGKTIKAVEVRIARLVEEAPELTGAQLERLRAILSTAAAAVAEPRRAA